MTVIEKIRNMSEDELIEIIFKLSETDEYIFERHCRSLPKCDLEAVDCCSAEDHKACIRAWPHSKL